ncbi:DUF4185 domain-containing protein [Spirillospora albida]|uniref:DUF4185 domain-containing protein n=1 Tax=Spirillospora albida TaxID=58123 RepID=UPI0004C0856E|nr:DUF4185 domain-containing protein [Spirillospora albida]
MTASGVAVAAPASAAPPAGTIQSTTDLGPLAWDSRIIGRDAGFSVKWGSGSIWVFGDTAMTVAGSDGDNWADNTSATTTDLSAANGISLLPPAGRETTDGAGVPTEYLPLSQWESYFNHANDPVRCSPPGQGDCGKQYFLWPAQPVADPARNRVIYPFTSGIRGGSVTDPFGQYWGTGFAVWNASTGAMTRPETGPVPGGASWDKWVMFHGQETSYTPVTTVGSTVYSVGCAQDWVVYHCSLARVGLADILNRSAWRFYAGGGTWSATASDAVTIFDGGSSNSMFYNPYLGKYVAVYGFDRVSYRTADQPWGPWSDEAKLFDTVPAPQGKYNYFGLAHPEYGNGRTLYLTYSHPTSDWGGEVRVQRVVFN